MDRKTKLKFEIFAAILVLNLSGSLYVPYISIYYQHYGLSKSVMGLLTCLGPVLIIFLQPRIGKIADKTGKGKAICSVFFALLSVMMLGYLKFPSIAMIVIGAFGYQNLHYSAGAIFEGVVGRVTREENIDYSKVRFLASIGYASGPLIFGSEVSRNIDFIFIYTIVVSLLTAILIMMIPNECFIVPEKKEEKETAGRTFQSNEYIYVFVLIVVGAMGSMISYSFFGPIALENGIDETLIGRLSFLSAFAEILTVPIAKKMNEKYDAVKIFTVLGVGNGAMLLIGSTGKLLLMFVAYFMQGVFFMTATYSSLVYVSSHCIPGRNSEAQTKLTAVRSGIGTILAGIVGGQVLTLLGNHNGLITMGIVTILLTLFASHFIYIHKRNIKEDLSC